MLLLASWLRDGLVGRRGAERRRCCFIPTVRNRIEAQPIWRRAECSERRRAGVVRVWQRQQCDRGECNERLVVGQGELRREENPQGQRIDGPGQRDDPLCQRVRAGLPGPDAELHRQRIGRGNQRIQRQSNRFRRVGLAAERTNEYAAAQQRCGSPAWNLPVVFGPIAITYNVKGVNSLSLDGPTAAKIFNGAITTVERPGDPGAQPGRHAARRADSRRLPQR